MVTNRVILLVLDACGIGELPDASDYGDSGAATIPNVARMQGGLRLPTLERLGLGNLAEIAGVRAADLPVGAYGKMAERAPGKDSTTGHWELAGYILPAPLPLFPGGFPEALVRAFEHEAKVTTIGNVAASGTEIIDRLGEEHLRTGALILYTSADSVFQLAAHDDRYSLPDLYRICRIARMVCTGEYNVGRVIARPFEGPPGQFRRTAGRKDFSRTPPVETLLDRLIKNGRDVLAIGKIYDLFAGRGITESVKAGDNDAVMAALLSAVQKDTRHSLIFANAVDFDQAYGHRNDPAGFAQALERIDGQIAALMNSLRSDDILIVTADHGCDPTLSWSTDHTREYVPLLVTGAHVRPGGALGTRSTFADVAKTILDCFLIPNDLPGESFRLTLKG